MSADVLRHALRLVPSAQREVPHLLRFEDSPAVRHVVQLSLGPAGTAAAQVGRWVYGWLLECGCWPNGSILRSSLRAAGSELRFIGELLAMRDQGRLCQQVLSCVDTLSLGLGEEIPQATRGAFRDTVLLHVIEPEAREAFETLGLILWEGAVRQEPFGKAVVPGAAADLQILADYLTNLGRMAAEPQEPDDHHLAHLPCRLAIDVAQLAQAIER